MERQARLRFHIGKYIDQKVKRQYILKYILGMEGGMT
jgi:hypothetical protein